MANDWDDMVDVFGVYDCEDDINYFGELGEEYIEECRINFRGDY